MKNTMGPRAAPHGGTARQRAYGQAPNSDAAVEQGTKIKILFWTIRFPVCYDYYTNHHKIITDTEASRISSRCICPFNLFPKDTYKNRRRHLYTFANLCREDPTIELGDETEKIFLCADGDLDDISEDLRAFLKYIADGMTGSQFTKELDEAVDKARLHAEWRVEYMTLLEHYAQEREEGRLEGIELGRNEEKKKTEQQRRRAEAAEAKVRELEQQLAELSKSLDDGTL